MRNGLALLQVHNREFLFSQRAESLNFLKSKIAHSMEIKDSLFLPEQEARVGGMVAPGSDLASGTRPKPASERLGLRTDSSWGQNSQR